ncbi:MAG: type II secretion system F family protein, partial [Planctomycetota bacterium]|nr:type II secretion system F family protein [Planctomycetota bacterium]
MAHIFLRKKKGDSEDGGSGKKDKSKKLSKISGSLSRAADRDDSQMTRMMSHPKIRSTEDKDSLPATRKFKRIERDESSKTGRFARPKMSAKDATTTGVLAPGQTGRFRRTDALKGDAPGPGQKLFKFRAIKYVGKEKNEVSGIMVGEDEKDVSRRLQQTDHVIVSVREKKTFEFGGKMFRQGQARRAGSVPLNDLLMFTQQLATMVEAGNPLLSSLEVLRDQSQNPRLKAALGDVSEEIRQGAGLSDSLGRHPKIFNELYVSLVKAGETSGRLSLNLLDLADTLEEQAALRNDIISAMTYPVISLVVILGV